MFLVWPQIIILMLLSHTSMLIRGVDWHAQRFFVFVFVFKENIYLEILIALQEVVKTVQRHLVCSIRLSSNINED